MSSTTTVKKGNTILGENGTFSGADMMAHIIFPGRAPITLGEVTTMTYSTYRETHPVRTLGRINVKGFSKGPRTIAGTMIFTVFNKHVVNSIKDELANNKDEVDYLSYIKNLKPCELPPFDIMITFGNEYGASAKLFIYGIEVVDEGNIFSVEDLFTENTWSYMARDIGLMDDIDAEQNTPLISLGELESAGKFKVSDLVLDDAYTQMQSELAALKKDKDAAIQAAREQSKNYISTTDNWGFEETTIPQTNIPGGDGTADQLPVDPTHVDCKKPKLEVYNSGEKTKSVTTDDREIYFNVDIADFKWGQFKEIFGHINGTEGDKKKKVTLSWSCDGGGATWDVGFKSTSAINTIRQNITAKLVIKDYYLHKPEPVDLTIKINTFTLNDGTNVKIQSPASIKLKTNDGKISTKPVTFKLIKEGSKVDKTDQENDQITCDITFTPISQIFTSVFGHSQRGSYCQYFFRDATSIGYEFVKDANKRPLIDTYQPEGLPKENDWITPRESWMDGGRIFDIHKKQYDEHGTVEKCKLVGHDPESGGFKLYSSVVPTKAGFFVNIVCKKNGKVMTSKETKDFYLKFDYKVRIYVRGKSYIIDGDSFNNNIVKYDLEEDAKAWFRTSKYYKVSDLNSKSRSIALTDPEISFLPHSDTVMSTYTKGIATTVFNAVHKLHDGKLPSGKEDVNWFNDSSKCKCRFKYSDMTLMLYDFKVCTGSGPSAKELKTGTIKGASTSGDVRFPILNMDDEVLKEILGKDSRF